MRAPAFILLLGLAPSAPAADYDLPKPPPGFHSADMGVAASSSPAAAAPAASSDYDLPKPPPGFHSPDMDLVLSSAAPAPSPIAASSVAVVGRMNPAPVTSSNTARTIPTASTGPVIVEETNSTPSAAGFDLPKPPPGFHSADMGVVFPSSTAPAGNAPPAPTPEQALPKAPPGRGWVATPSSILLYDSAGARIQEIGLARWKENDNGVQKRHTTRGGAAANGRFAWAWEKIETLAAPPQPGASPIVVDSSQLLRYLGTDGQELWRDQFADASTDDLGPAIPSADGETTLVLRRVDEAWSVVVYDFIGLPVLEAKGDGVLQLALISPSGRFGLVRWHLENQPPVYTYLDIGNKKHSTLPLANIPTLPMRVADDGRVYAGDKVLYQAP